MNYRDILICQQDVLEMINEFEIENFIPVTVKKEPFEKKPIWVYWDQGIDNAPELVQVCVKSLNEYRSKDTTELIIIDRNNLSNYIEIPNFVLKNIGTNYTALSNIIRASLLYCYGGMWVDATYLFTKNIPEKIFNQNFWAIKEIYPVKTIDQKIGSNIYDFSYNLMYSEPENEMLKFIYNILCNYWKNYNYLKHYHLKDGVIFYGYNYQKYPVSYINNLEITNNNMYAFDFNKLNEFYSPEALIEKEGHNTFCFKLTYKTNILFEKINGKITFWGYFKEKYLNKENK